MKNLFSELRFRNGVVAKNRVVLAALTNMQSHADGTLSEDELRFLRMRAEGGFGVVTSCASHVAKDGQGWPGELACFSDAHVPGLTRLAEVIHAHGARALVQIFHGGLRADASVSGEKPWTASETAEARAATHDDLERVVVQFADAAARAHAAGMDGVEIHGAHGYLLTQFLSNVENTRTDAYGGSLENRARLMRRVVRAVRARVPAGFVVGIRISPEDFGNAKGLDLDENLQLARWLVDDGVDFLHLSLWTASMNTKKRPEVHALQAFREVLPTDVPMLVAGKIWTREDADHLLTLGADAVAIGRGAIGNHDWAARATSTEWVPKKPPFTEEALRGEGLSAGFANYMRKWKGFVQD